MTAPHKGLPVPGYKPQTDTAVATVKRSKEIEERVLRFLDELVRQDDIDPRWISTARTDIEKGFMALNRSVFRPGRAALPEDPVPEASE